jgi:hypothetical protein
MAGRGKAARRTPRLDPKKFSGVKRTKSWSDIRHFFESQIEPSLEKLYDRKFDDRIKPCLKNYLITSLVSVMEYFFKNEARRVVDEYDMDIARLFKGEVTIPFSNLEYLIKEGSITKGNVIASSFNFANLNDLNELFSKLLNLNFFDYVRKLDRSDRSRYVFDGHPIDIDYKKLKEAFELRHQVVHEMKQVELSNWQLVCRWDNAMNIMDAAGAMFIPEIRQSLDEAVERQTKKEIHRGKREENDKGS